MVPPEVVECKPVALFSVTLLQNEIKQYRSADTGAPLFSGFTAHQAPFRDALFFMASIFCLDMHTQPEWNPLEDIQQHKILNSILDAHLNTFSNSWMSWHIMMGQYDIPDDREASAKLNRQLQRITQEPVRYHEFRRFVSAKAQTHGLSQDDIKLGMGFSSELKDTVMHNYIKRNPQAAVRFFRSLAGFSDDLSSHYLLRSLVSIPDDWLEILFPGIGKAEQAVRSFQMPVWISREIKQLMSKQLLQEHAFLRVLKITGKAFFQALPFILQACPDFGLLSVVPELATLIHTSEWHATQKRLGKMQDTSDALMANRERTLLLWPILLDLQNEQEDMPNYTGPQNLYDETVLCFSMYPGIANVSCVQQSPLLKSLAVRCGLDVSTCHNDTETSAHKTVTEQHADKPRYMPEPSSCYYHHSFNKKPTFKDALLYAHYVRTSVYRNGIGYKWSASWRNMIYKWKKAEHVVGLIADECGRTKADIMDKIGKFSTTHNLSHSSMVYALVQIGLGAAEDANVSKDVTLKMLKTHLCEP